MIKKSILVSLCIFFSFACNRQNSTKGEPPQRELNLLCWTGYEEPQFLGVFERAYNVKVNYKTFFGGDGMLALLSQSPATYDVVVVDKDYLAKLYAAGRLLQLSPSDFDFSHYFTPFRNTYGWIDGKLYSVVVEFGSSALVYNTSRLTAQDVSSYQILWSPKVKGKVGIWDWYLPNMGNVSQFLGNKLPFDLSDGQFTLLKDKLSALRPQVKAFHSSPAEIISALSSEQTWIIPGSGEWLASILKQQGKPIDWVVPKEGGLIWANTLAIPNDAPHKETALQYIKWMQTPAAQALLSQKKAFNSNVTNEETYALLTPEQKSLLQVHNDTEATALVAKLSDRILPKRPPEKSWQDAWEAFKAAAK